MHAALCHYFDVYGRVTPSVKMWTYVHTGIHTRQMSMWTGTSEVTT